MTPVIAVLLGGPQDGLRLQLPYPMEFMRMGDGDPLDAAASYFYDRRPEPNAAGELVYVYRQPT